MKVFQLLNPAEVQELRSKLQGQEFADGRSTARGSAIDKKQNSQLAASSPYMQSYFAELNRKFIANGELKAYTQPARLVSPRVSRYVVGDHYKWHVDLATIEGVRTDLSFTLFLSGKSEYEGGELQMNHGTHVTSFRGEPGQIIFYPTGVKHQVTEITKGERLVIVGWVRSHIRSAEQRELLFNLIINATRIRSRDGLSNVYEELHDCYQGLLRNLAD